MDEKLLKALEFANYKHTLYLEKIRLQEKLKTDLTYSYNGGLFYLDKAFIANLLVFENYSPNPKVILLDDRLYPIEIENIKEFIRLVVDLHQTVMTEYYQNFNQLKQKRSARLLVGQDE